MKAEQSETETKASTKETKGKLRQVHKKPRATGKMMQWESKIGIPGRGEPLLWKKYVQGPKTSEQRMAKSADIASAETPPAADSSECSCLFLSDWFSSIHKVSVQFYLHLISMQYWVV